MSGYPNLKTDDVELLKRKTRDDEKKFEISNRET